MSEASDALVRPPRWDPDERGIGVADARAHLARLDGLHANFRAFGVTLCRRDSDERTDAQDDSAADGPLEPFAHFFLYA